MATAMLVGCMPPELPAIDRQKAHIDASAALRQAADGPDPVTRANAIEATSQTVGIKAGPLFKQALEDQYPTVRFAAAMAIGDVRYQPAKAMLLGFARGADKCAVDTRGKRTLFFSKKYNLCSFTFSLENILKMKP